METHTLNQNKLLKEEGRWFVLYFCVFLLVYGYTILRLGLDTDDIHDFFGQEGGLYTAAGRWCVTLWRFIFGEGACLWAASITAGLLISGVIILQCHLLKLTGNLQRLLYGGFYLSCCQFNNMLQFSFLCDTMAASFLAVTGAVWMLQKDDTKATVLSIILLTFALGAYQANCFYFSTLFLAVELRTIQLGDGAEGFKKRFKKLIAIGLIATAIWYVIFKITIHMPFVTEEQINFASGYQSSINYWNRFFEANLPEKWYLIMGACSLSLFIKWSGIASLVAVVLLGRNYIKQLGIKNAKLPIALLILLCLSPYGLNFALLRPHEEWSLIAEPIMIASVWALLTTTQHKLSPRMLRCLLIFLAFSLVKGMYANAAWAKNERHEHEMLIAEIHELRSASNAAAIHAGLEKANVVLLGDPWLRENIDQQASDCALTWANVMRYYLRYLKLKNIHVGTKAEHEKHNAIFETMPTWPATGSVLVVGDEVLIRIGPNSYK